MNGDCATYSMVAEHLKIAFRCSYRLFDKVACFVNAYWSIGLPERAVNFRRLWFDVDDGKAKSSLNVRARFDASRNGHSAVCSRYPEICLRRIFKSLRNPMRRSLPTSVTILNTSISNLSRCLSVDGRRTLCGSSHSHRRTEAVRGDDVPHCVARKIGSHPPWPGYAYRRAAPGQRWR